jgi:Phage integrase, N-terminal SAM-like domain
MRFRASHRDVPSLTNDDPPGKAPDHPSPKTVSSANDANTSPGVSWIAVYTRLANDLQVRHYAPNTLKAYTQWVRHFHTCTRRKDPAPLSAAEVREFLTSLAVARQVSASTQNQAFTARLFFYRPVLNKEFGKVEGVVRAQRTPDVPVV